MNRPQDSFHHSRSYHSFFEGYTEKQIVDERGRSRIKRVYTADYYILDVTGQKRRLIKLLFVLMYAAVICSQLAVSHVNLRYENVWYMALPQFIGILITILLFPPILRFCRSPERMTLHDLHSGYEALGLLPLITAIALWINIPATLIYLLSSDTEPSSAALFHCLAYAAGGAAALVIYLIRRRLSCHSEENDTELPDGNLIS